VVVAAQVQHAVHDGFGQILGVVGADHHVAKLARPRHRSRLVQREGEHVGGLVASPVLAVERLDALGVDQLNREMPVLDARGGKRRQRRRAQLLGRADEV
jgi:hypothetical protein